MEEILKQFPRCSEPSKNDLREIEDFHQKATSCLVSSSQNDYKQAESTQNSSSLSLYELHVVLMFIEKYPVHEKTKQGSPKLF